MASAINYFVRPPDFEKQFLKIQPLGEKNEGFALILEAERDLETMRVVMLKRS